MEIQNSDCTPEDLKAQMTIIRLEQPLIHDLIIRKWGSVDLAEALNRMTSYSTNLKFTGPERRREVRKPFSGRVSTALYEIAESHNLKFGFDSSSTFV